jgi:hypothetical protein
MRQEGHNRRGDLKLGQCGGKEEQWEERAVGKRNLSQIQQDHMMSEFQRTW